MNKDPIPENEDLQNLTTQELLRVLINSFGGVQRSVAEASLRIDEHQKLIMNTMDRYRTVLSMVGVAVLIIVCLLGFGGFLLNNQNDNTKNIQDLQNRTSSEILCPLYGVLINSINANPAPPNLSPDQIEFRRNAVLTLQKGYADLGCRPQ